MQQVRAEAPIDEAISDKPRLVVGIFDSRAVAIAYMRSARFNAAMNVLKRDYEKAKADGDEERLSELEAKGLAIQQLGHQQVFGNAPIPNVLEAIENKLATVAEQAGVDVMVSKWRIAYEGPNAKYVDVTDNLVILFEPDDETLDVIKQIKPIEPLPADQLKSHDH
jgi:hypothetical protein